MLWLNLHYDLIIVKYERLEILIIGMIEILIIEILFLLEI